jgi:hypothetical protein
MQCRVMVLIVHGEIYDTEVRDNITYQLTKWASLACGMKIAPDYWNL